MQLTLRDICKTYPNGVQALDHVSLTIPVGMYGLLGPNGAGKSTLMRILATLQEADSGSAMLGDLDVLHRKEEVRKTLGYLPQEFGVYPHASAHALLDYFAVLKGVAGHGAASTHRKTRGAGCGADCGAGRGTDRVGGAGLQEGIRLP